MPGLGLDGARLKALRELKGIRTQQALADLVSLPESPVPQSHIWDLEKGKLRNQAVFLRVVDELDCTTDFLFRRGPFKDADEPEELHAAASQMSFDSFCGRIDTRQIDKERCARVLGHPGAPITADGWQALAEMIARVFDAPSPFATRITA